MEAGSADVQTEEMLIGRSELGIFPVPESLRNLNTEAYAPRLIGMGPFHHFRPLLYKMEAHKLAVAKRGLQRFQVPDLQALVREIHPLIPRIRACYNGGAGLLGLSSETLAMVTAIDGLFFYELIRGDGDDDDLPGLCEPPSGGGQYFFEYLQPVKFSAVGKLIADICRSFGRPLPFDSRIAAGRKPPLQSIALNDIVLLENQIPISIVDETPAKFRPDAGQIPTRRRPIVGPRSGFFLSPRLSDNPAGAGELGNIRLKFRGKTGDLRIEFDEGNKTITIPTFRWNPYSEVVIRNLAIYEAMAKASPSSSSGSNNNSNDDVLLLIQYIHFMHMIIRQPKDIRFLMDAGVIEESEETGRILRLFSSLCTCCSSENRLLDGDLKLALNKHCSTVYRAVRSYYCAQRSVVVRKYAQLFAFCLAMIIALPLWLIPLVNSFAGGVCLFIKVYLAAKSGSGSSCVASNIAMFVNGTAVAFYR